MYAKNLRTVGLGEFIEGKTITVFYDVTATKTDAVVTAGVTYNFLEVHAATAREAYAMAREWAKRLTYPHRIYASR